MNKSKTFLFAWCENGCEAVKLSPSHKCPHCGKSNFYRNKARWIEETDPEKVTKEMITGGIG